MGKKGTTDTGQVSENTLWFKLTDLRFNTFAIVPVRPQIPGTSQNEEDFWFVEQLLKPWSKSCVRSWGQAKSGLLSIILCWKWFIMDSFNDGCFNINGSFLFNKSFFKIGKKSFILYIFTILFTVRKNGSFKNQQRFFYCVTNLYL